MGDGGGHVRRRVEVADLRVERGVDVQELDLERGVFPARGAAVAPHGQRDLLRVGGAGVGLVRDAGPDRYREWGVPRVRRGGRDAELHLVRPHALELQRRRVPVRRGGVAQRHRGRRGERVDDASAGSGRERHGRLSLALRQRHGRHVRASLRDGLDLQRRPVQLQGLPGALAGPDERAGAADGAADKDDSGGFGQSGG